MTSNYDQPRTLAKVNTNTTDNIINNIMTLKIYFILLNDGYDVSTIKKTSKHMHTHAHIHTYTVRNKGTEFIVST